MAAHLQQQILDALAATLLAAGTSAGLRVYVDRPDELPVDLLPAIVLESGAEQVAVLSQDWPFVQERAFEFAIGIACAGPTADADARETARQVEAALHASLATATADGIMEPVELTGSVKDKTGQASKLLFNLQQSWRTTYYTKSNAPDIPLTL